MTQVRRREWTTTEIKTMREWWSEGKPVKWIADQLGRSVDSIDSAKAYHGFPKRNRGPQKRVGV